MGIVASNLGATVLATDGDDAVVQLLSANMASNAPRSRVVKLDWGSAESLTSLGSLNNEFDFLLAADVVFGNDPQQWRALMKTIKVLSGHNTLVLIANFHRYPLGHPCRQEMDAAFYIPILEEFEAKVLPQSLLHADLKSVENCAIQVLRRKAAITKRKSERELDTEM